VASGTVIRRGALGALLLSAVLTVLYVASVNPATDTCLRIAEW
jgi:hypothetical protein